MSKTKPWLADDGKDAAIKHAPATMRNRDAIVAILTDILPDQGTVLEIASGSGEHIVYFDKKFSHLCWQPSDPDPDACASIRAWIAKEQSSNILPPLQLSALDAKWPVDQPSAIICINMVHISAWEATIGLFQKASDLLQSGALLYFYGPYFREWVETAESNMQFDRDLRRRNHQWGLRDLADMDAVAGKNGFHRDAVVEMPSNNLSLVYRKS